MLKGFVFARHRDLDPGLVGIGPEAEEQAHSEHNSTTRLMDGLEVQNNDGSQEVQWSPHFV
jgi:hypothetical protein